MKWLPALAFALAISALVLALLTVATAWLPVTIAASFAGCAVGTLWSGRTVARDLAVRTLVTTACHADADGVRVKDLVLILGTPDVVKARKEQMNREATTLAQRYANGDASDH